MGLVHKQYNRDNLDRGIFSYHLDMMKWATHLYITGHDIENYDDDDDDNDEA